MLLAADFISQLKMQLLTTFPMMPYITHNPGVTPVSFTLTHTVLHGTS